MGPKLKSKKHEEEVKETSDGSKKTKRKIGGKKRIGKNDSPKLDAFQLLMDSRKKVIGDNASGKEFVSSDDNADAYQQKMLKSQRKSFLEKWAEKKGGARSKELDVAHSERIKGQLKKRKKRLTNMLLNKVEESKELLTTDSCKVNETNSICTDDKIEINGETKKNRKKLTKKKYDEDDEFLCKLSPSLKEKNMLRYFKKLDIDNDVIVVDKTRLKQKVVKKKKVAENKHEDEVVKNTNKCDYVDNEIISSNSKRIRKKVVYVESESDSDMIVEVTVPKKKSIKKSSVNINKENVLNQNKIVSPIKIVNIKSSDAIKCVRSPKTAKTTVTEPPGKKMKIAPLFLKAAPKPMVCPTVIEARQKFLYSESPKMAEKPTEMLQNYISDINYFPEISHIQQIPISDDDSWNLPVLSDYNNSISDILEEDDGIKYEYFKRNDVKDLNNLQSSQTIYQMFDCFKFIDTKEGLQHMKKMYPNFPIYKYFRLMKEKCLNLHCQDEGVLWTEKYKPLCTDDIVGNRKSINALKNWLLSWKECTKQAFCKLDVKKRRNSSSDDFFTSDSDSNDAIKLPNNVKIIVGPVGSGKTSSIYAIANELDLNILEVNASSKRTGKRIITVLQEATQSHKILTKNNSEDISSDSKRNIRLNSSKRKKSLKKCKSEEVSQNNDNKMSLMLIEDADIVFEEDDGFESALVHIVQTTKRPIIIVVSNLNCHSIKRIIGNNNVLKFNCLSGKLISPWLDIMIFLESGLFVPQMSTHIINSNGCDMRKSILQVQFCVSSYKNSNLHNGKELDMEEISDNNDSNMSWNGNEVALDSQSKSNIKLNLFNSLEQFSKTNLWLDINKLHQHLIYTINNSESKTVNNSKNLDSLSDIMDGLSMMDMMQSCNKNYSKNNILSWRSNPSDSLSIYENEHEYKHLECLSSNWCQSFIDMNSVIVKNIYDDKSCDVHSFIHSDERWITKQHAVYRDLSEAVSLTGELDRSSLALDYVSILRYICRLEKHRSDTNIKRNNRFYHYFRSLGIDASDAVLDEACDIIKPI